VNLAHLNQGVGIADVGQDRQLAESWDDLAQEFDALARKIVGASTSSEINAAFATTVRERSNALFVGQDAFFNSRRVQLTHLASRHTLPAIYAGVTLP
jgi:hypothetical protein